MSDPIISVSGLSRRFGSFVAVDGVTFEVEAGEIFGYLGANGAGKSTTIRMLTGLLRPSSGRAVVAGWDVAVDPRKVKRCIGYMSQKFSLYLDLTIQENLEFYGGAYGLRGTYLKKQLGRALELAHLVGQEKTLTAAVPQGIRQRLGLASALLHEPRVVFLDEPTAGVSPDARRQFWRTIRQLAHEGTTIFVTTHYLDEAEYCQRVGLMDQGRLVALDTPIELKRQHAPGVMVSIRGGSKQRAILQALSGVEGVLAIQPFGQELHLRMEPRLGQDWLAGFLAGRGYEGVAIEPIQPNLEDVFLSVVNASIPPTGPSANA